MKENKLIKLLIPVIAVIVVFESIFLVSNLGKNPSKTDKLEEVGTSEDTSGQNQSEKPAVDFIWEADNLEMNVGKTYNVTLNMLNKRDLILDAVEAHIYFDPKMVTVSNLETNKAVGEELKQTGIDSKIGSITAILFNEVKGVGYEGKKSENVKILSFMVTPKIEGKISFDLSTSMDDNKFATIIVEMNTSKSLVYSSNKLEINAVK